jgi:DUF4097 and DUF4098 domain-containing protein YvlB
MNKGKICLIISGVIIVTCLSGCTGINPEVTEFFNEEYQIDEESTLSISNVNGQIEVSDSSNDNLIIDAVKRTRHGEDELKNMEINVTKSGNQFVVTTIYDKGWNVKVSVDINIKIPNTVSITSVETTNGAIQLSNAKGNATLTSSNGPIIAENINGYITASTSNGDIQVKNTTGTGNLETHNGRITVDILNIQEDIEISTSNGRITTYINPNLDIEIDATTSNGVISMTGLTLNITTSEDTHFQGIQGNGTYKVELKTSNGEIRIHKKED